jgi:hypothetical protein
LSKHGQKDQKKLSEIERLKEFKELQTCTFTPSINKRKKSVKPPASAEKGYLTQRSPETKSTVFDKL